jgi:PTS system N-acetylgalactosamine-specific IIA component
MIGLLISGHGEFASGLQSSIQLIAGEQENMEYVDFVATDSTEDLEQKVRQALTRLQECTEILILCDLVGGSPFKVAATISVNEPNIAVIGGTNLPMAIEVSLTKNYLPFSELIAVAIDAGKNAIQLFEWKRSAPVDIEEDGI